MGGRIARLLAAAAAGWVLIVAVMTQAGYAGNPRYNVAAAAVGCVLAGVGVAAAGRARGSPLAVALLLAVAGGLHGRDLRDQASELHGAPTGARTSTRWCGAAAARRPSAAAARSAPTSR